MNRCSLVSAFSLRKCRFLKVISYLIFVGLLVLNTGLRKGKPGTIMHIHLKWPLLSVLPLAVVMWSNLQLLTDLNCKWLMSSINLFFLLPGQGLEGRLSKKTLGPLEYSCCHLIMTSQKQEAGKKCRIFTTHVRFLESQMTKL